jgi:hypothetical protein
MINQTDFLTNDFFIKETQVYVLKNLKLSKSLLLFSIIFGIIQLLRSSKLLIYPKPDYYSHLEFLVQLRINPAIYCVELLISVYCYALLRKGYKKLNTAFEENNPLYFKEGFLIFNRMNTISVILLAIATLFGFFTIYFEFIQ